MGFRGSQKKLLTCLVAALMVETLYIVNNSGYRSEEPAEDITIIKLRRKFQQPVNFTQDEIFLLENGFNDQQHPLLLERLRTHWIHKPSPGPPTLSNMTRRHYSQHGQSEMVEKLLPGKTNGFFIECGAFDGETDSNSLFFERSRNWTGLLIEADPKTFEKLHSKHRNAYSINACLNTVNRTGKYSYSSSGGLGGLVHEMKHNMVLGPKITVQCFTLQSILIVLGVRHIDFFSLDVEGAELGVLKTIPFSYFDIDIFLIEYMALGTPEQITDARAMSIDRFLTLKGYERIKKTFVDLLYRKRR